MPNKSSQKNKVHDENDKSIIIMSGIEKARKAIEKY